MNKRRRSESFKALGIFACLGFMTALPIVAFAQTQLPFDSAHALSYFEEAHQLSEKEGGKLWGRKLYGALLFVDLETHAVIANQQDAQGRLHRHGDVFEGKLSNDVEPSNAPLEWSGTRWQSGMLLHFVNTAISFSRLQLKANKVLKSPKAFQNILELLQLWRT